MNNLTIEKVIQLENSKLDGIKDIPQYVKDMVMIKEDLIKKNETDQVRIAYDIGRFKLFHIFGNNIETILTPYSNAKQAIQLRYENITHVDINNHLPKSWEILVFEKEVLVLCIAKKHKCFMG